MTEEVAVRVILGMRTLLGVLGEVADDVADLVAEARRFAGSWAASDVEDPPHRQ